MPFTSITRFLRIEIILFSLVCISLNCHTPSKLASAENQKDEFTFFVLGDWGMKGGKFQQPVANAMIRESKQTNLSCILTVGDNFYDDGVKTVHDEDWKLSYENVYGELTRSYPWYVTLGNHDYRGNPQAQIEYHSINKNWNLPAYYYTVVKPMPGRKKIRFIIIDTDPFVPAYYKNPLYKNAVTAQDTAKQLRWLEEVLTSSNEDWNIVLGHHPVYASNSGPNETSILLRVMKPLFEKYKVQAYICGHDHIMQFHKPSGSFTSYIISGAGSSPGEATKADFTVFTSGAPAFTECKIKNDSLTFRFVDTTGATLYSHVIPK
jgi:tartrate-resistant acid phosphatase type 5